MDQGAAKHHGHAKAATSMTKRQIPRAYPARDDLAAQSVPNAEGIGRGCRLAPTTNPMDERVGKAGRIGLDITLSPPGGACRAGNRARQTASTGTRMPPRGASPRR